MKLHNVEGTPEEISNFFQNNGLNLADYFDVPEKPLAKGWIFLPGILGLVCMLILVFANDSSDQVRTFVFICSAACAIWSGVVVQLRFKNAWAAGFVVVGGLLLTLVATGVLTPNQMYQEMKSLRKDSAK